MRADIARVEVARQRDLPVLDRMRREGSAGKHAQRLAAQRRGTAVYLLGWWAGVPVGHAFLKWPGGEPGPAGPACPDLEDLFVQADHRRRGLATRLLQRAAEECGRQGYAQLGLAVALDNHGARALYEGLGFRPVGAPFTLDYELVDVEGVRRTWSEEAIYVVRSLR